MPQIFCFAVDACFSVSFVARAFSGLLERVVVTLSFWHVDGLDVRKKGGVGDEDGSFSPWPRGGATSTCIHNGQEYLDNTSLLHARNTTRET